MLRMKAIKLNYQNIRVKVNKLIFQSYPFGLQKSNTKKIERCEKKTRSEEQTNDNNVVICHRIQSEVIVLQKSSLIAESASKQSQA